MIGIAPRRVALALTVLATSCAVAACGSSSSSSTTSASASSSNTSTTAAGGRFNSTAFRSCLKQHGVTLPTRRPGAGAPGAGGPPAGGGGGFFGGGGGAARGRFSNPKFRAAIQACGGGNFRAGGRAGGRFRISHTTINNYVACVRKHGFPQMPSPNFSGSGGVFPANIRTNPKFQTASRACQSILVPARPGGTSTTAAS